MSIFTLIKELSGVLWGKVNKNVNVTFRAHYCKTIKTMGSNPVLI